MHIFSAARPDHASAYAGAVPGYSPAAIANRRRRLVFSLVFLLAGAVSLGYVFSRPAEYQAVARVQIVFPGPADAADERTEGSNPLLLTEVQVLTSRPLVEKLVAALRAGNLALPDAGDDPVSGIQRSLAARPLAGTNVVEIKASGFQAERLAPLLNTLFAVYRDQLAASYQRTNSDESAQASEEARSLEAKLLERRRAVDAFRARHNIVSLEREENQILAQVKGQGVSLNAARDKVLAAEARLRSLRESIAAGKAVVRAKDNPTLANIEQRHSQAREELRDLERSFTEAYLSFDPKAKSLRIRVADLEEQLKQAREAGQQAALAEAEEELAGARSAAERLAQQMAGDRQGVQVFTARLAEYAAMQEELGRIEALHRAAATRAVALGAAEKSRAPSVRLLDPASTPQTPWRPKYAEDAAIAIAGSLLLALLVLAIVELFTRPDRQPTMVMAPAWMSLPLDIDRAPALTAAAGPALLAEAARLPRELEEAEVGALIDAAPPAARPALVALMSGLSVEELVALRWGDVDLAGGKISLPGRQLPIAGPLRALLTPFAGTPPAPDAPVLSKADGSRETADEIEARVVFAAHDAGIERPDEVTPAALRHTYTAFLVRQGARFGDLAQLVGRLPAAALTAYGPLAPPGPKRPIDDIDPILPALRRLLP